MQRPKMNENQTKVNKHLTFYKHLRRALYQQNKNSRKQRKKTNLVCFLITSKKATLHQQKKVKKKANLSLYFVFVGIRWKKETTKFSDKTCHQHVFPENMSIFFVWIGVKSFNSILCCCVVCGVRVVRVPLPLRESTTCCSVNVSSSLFLWSSSLSLSLSLSLVSCLFVFCPFLSLSLSFP